MKEIKDLEAIQDNRFSGNSTNTKELYIVDTHEPTGLTKARSDQSITVVKTYLATRADETSAAVKMSGYDISHNSNIIAQLKDTKTYNEAIDLAKKESLEFQVLTLPWQRIIRIKQLKFTLAKNAQ